MSEPDEKRAEAGHVLFREGDDGNTLFVLREGEVAISKEVKGDKKLLARLGGGEFFGEMAILNNRPRTATATAQTEIRYLELDASTFERLITRNTEVALRLIQKLARRLESADELIEVLMHRDPRGRVLLGLSREAHYSGVEREDGILVPLEPRELADQVGIDFSETQPLLTRLSRLGIIEESAEGILIKDVDRLEDFYEFLEERAH